MKGNNKTNKELQKDLDILRAQNEILLSNKQLNIEIFNASSEAIIIIEKTSGYIINVNKSFLVIFGYSDIQEVISNTVNNYLSENYIEKTKKLINESNITDAPQKISFIERAKRKDGSLFWTEVFLKFINVSGIESILVFIKDITNQKLSEEALNISENQYKNLFENMPNGYYKSTPKGYFVDANPAFIKMLGYESKEELLSVFIPDALYVKSSERDEIMDENQNFVSAFEIYRLKTKDGGIIWVEDNARYIKDDSGKTIYNEGICRDITQRKLAEEALKKSEERFRQMADLLPQTIFELDVKGNLIFANRMAFDVFGYTREEFKKGISVLSMLMPEEHEKAIKNIGLVASGTLLKANEYTAVKRDGSKFPVLLSSSPIIENNVAIGIRGILVDITENKNIEKILRESENKFKSLFETSSDAIFIMNQSVFLDCNSKTYEIFGCSREQIIGHSPAEFSPEFQSDGIKSTEKAKEKINAALNGEPQFFEWLHKKFNGNEFNAEVSLNRIMIKDEYLLHAIVRDISGRKKAENKIRESEEKYRTLVENINEAIMYVGLDDNLKFINKRFTELFGYTEDEIIGKNVIQTLIQEKDIELIKKVNQDRRNGISSQYELELIRNDGNKIRFIINGAPLYDDNGQIIGSIATMTDISDRLKIESELIASEEKFRSIVQSLNDSITIVDIDGKVTYQSPAAIKTFGYNLDEITGKYLMDYFHPDDLNIALEEFEKVKSSTNDGLPSLFRIKHKNGNFVFIEAIGRNMANNRAINGVVFVSKNVTERIEAEKLLKQSEERYRITIEQTGHIVYDLDIINLKINLSGAIEQITGFSHEEVDNIAIETWQSLIHPDDFPLTKDLLLKAISETSNYTAEYRFRTKSGSYIFVEDNGIVLTDEKEIANRILGTMKDITDRKNAELAIKQKTKEIEIQNEVLQQLNEKLVQTNEYLTQAKKHAEESDRLKTAFLTNISHEIRTPMNGILGFAELLKMPDLTEQKNEEFINLIEQSGQRMLNIINDIVDIAKIESGQIQLHYQQARLNNIMKELYSFFKPEADKKNLNLICETGLQDSKEMIETDPTRLVQILTNLLKNAIKFTKSGSISFGYSLIGKMLQFYVKDTGIGIPEEQKDYIFERFVQGSMSLNRNYEGAGLGLSISKSYVEKLGGKIWLDSEINKGSTFFFEIPYHSGYLNISKPSQNNQVPAEISMTTILIVEDDPNSMYYLKEILTNVNTKLLIAGDGREAIDMVIGNPEIDLILMDLKMPVMDGYEATRQIKQLKPDIKIIAQTAFAATEELKKATEAGCDDFLIKPIRKEKLFELLLKFQPLR